jgi:hypothetical protein
MCFPFFPFLARKGAKKGKMENHAFDCLAFPGVKRLG